MSSLSQEVLAQRLDDLWSWDWGWDREAQGRSLNPEPRLEPQLIGKTQLGAFSKIQITWGLAHPTQSDSPACASESVRFEKPPRSLRGHSSWPWWPQGLLERHSSGPQAHAWSLHMKQLSSLPPPAPQACSDRRRTPPAAPWEGGSRVPMAENAGQTQEARNRKDKCP